MIKYQNYSHYKLPITTDPLKYGKLIDQSNNKFILQLSTRNVAVITQSEKQNFIRIFKNGDLVVEFRDKIINENSFIRTLNDTRFLFENDKLISTQILSTTSSVVIYKANLKYSDTNSVKIAPTNKIMEEIKNLWNWIYKNKFAELFILCELTAIFLIFYLLLVVFPEDNVNGAITAFSSHNIIKLRHVKSKNIWTDVSYNINNKVFTKDLFGKILNQFWESIDNQFTDNNHMFILFKVKYVNTEFSTIGKVQRINKSDKNWYIDFILENMKFKSEYYNETQIESFIFSYGFKPGKIQDKDIKNVSVIHQNYKNLKLPISMEAKDYGRLIVKNKIESGINYILQNQKGETIDFKKYEKYNEVELYKNGISLVKFTDIFINKIKFLRKFDNKYLYFENGQQILSTKEMKTKFIAKTKKTNNLISKFITLDIETFIHKNVLVPYLICFYDGKRVYPFGLWDYKNPELMILDCLKSIFIRKYDGYKIYIHNMAKFDIIFLLKYIVKVGIVHPVIHNARIISLHVNFGENGDYQIQFKDSYLLLLSSLAKLTRGFGVDTLKSVFPYLFVNENNLDYIGEVPDLKYFGNKITLNEYNEYKNNFNGYWNLKKEVLKYCEIDCVSLYQVIFKFSDLIFTHFGKNIHHYPTLPSLAFAIFRSKFMENENIPQITGKIGDDIRAGYTGGAVDVYIPKAPKKSKIKCYDVNSLYPSVMFKNFMPVGFPTYFEGNIRAENPEAFGFFYCKITAPDNIKHPIIQTHVKINGIVRTIAPIGQWTDMLFSIEMDNAEKYGYKFEILWGYTFEKAIIFKEYVSFLYTLRKEYPKSHPLNFIAKILLNSLYGRFGMDDNFANIDVIHKDYLADFENKFFDQIEEKIDLGEHKLVFYKNIDKTGEDNSIHNISIPIAAAITAYARIHMSQFKNNPKINLYYSDTDSIFTDSEIDESLISETELGKLKLESKCKKALFLAPKLYCLLTESGDFIHKVKGLKHEVDLRFEDFEKLLTKDFTIKKSQIKWKRSLTEGRIKVLDELYTLKLTENKRELIYDKNNNFVGTKAYKIDSNKTITK